VLFHFNLHYCVISRRGQRSNGTLRFAVRRVNQDK
jgi:hypothetical protein